MITGVWISRGEPEWVAFRDDGLDNVVIAGSDARGRLATELVADLYDGWVQVWPASGDGGGDG